MFEAAIRPVAAATGADLRPLDWRELVARFAAARDLRALVLRPTASGGSFAARAAAGLPYDVRDDNRDHGQPAVNFAGLGGVKPLETITAATTDAVAEGDQGTR